MYINIFKNNYIQIIFAYITYYNYKQFNLNFR